MLPNGRPGRLAARAGNDELEVGLQEVLNLDVAAPRVIDDRIFADLNTPQREAVETVEGPLLILAGAGSGKTRVLTRRIAHLIGNCEVHPSRILAMTFTNKAAGEIRDRVEELLQRSARGLWMGTFHSICARFLRIEAHAAGLEPNFSIYDTSDQLAVVRKAIKAAGLSDKDYPPKQIRGRISNEKNRMASPDAVEQRAFGFYDQQVATIYRAYQKELGDNNAVDFDDLLMRTVTTLRDNTEILEKYQNRFDYILIDEYQDTNRPQYLLAKSLAEHHQNICVVGDDDQSIYAWRGADIRNILDFEKDYPDTTTIRLEQNYRSTQVILDAGNAVISHNQGRKGKELWSDRAGGDQIRLRRTLDEKDEARWVCQVAQELKVAGKNPYRDTAVLYRTNAQSRALEEHLVRSNIPYVIVGDVKFYERKEIKDLLAYLRLIDNTLDTVSLARVVNTPKRGIGKTSFDRLLDYAATAGVSPYDALGICDRIETLSSGAVKKMKAFHGMIEGFRGIAASQPADELTVHIIKATEFLLSLGPYGQPDAESRRDNVQEMVTNIQAFVERAEDPIVSEFLREVSLMTDLDSWDEATDALTLMTMHSAKGLEFRAVIICGLEDGLFPIIRSAEDLEDDESLEEERRLFYVGITRAMDRLFLSYTRERRRYGGIVSSKPSRFLNEIPPELLDAGYKIQEFGDDYADVQDEDEAETVQPVRAAGELDTSVGAWVLHPTWGRGCIEAKSGGGEDAKLTIRFQGVTKKVVQRYAHLLPG
jgi:DNA helicase II / ATP-dependent DNA helicase PcrA